MNHEDLLRLVQRRKRDKVQKLVRAIGVPHNRTNDDLHETNQELEGYDDDDLHTEA